MLIAPYYVLHMRNAREKKHGEQPWQVHSFFEGQGRLERSKCEGVGLVKRVPTICRRSAQVRYEPQEEVEGVRQEVREVKDEENGEIKVEGEPHTS